MRSVPFVFLLLVSPCFGRLGDTREQAEARYGLPKSEKPPKIGSPLLEAARELTFEFEGWRIRCALLPAKDGQEYVVREEYTHKTGMPTIKDFERDAVLQAESSGMMWQDRPASAPRNEMLHRMLANSWSRSDGAVAGVGIGGFPLRLELPQAETWEAELARLADQKARTEASRIIQSDSAPAPAVRPVPPTPVATSPTSRSQPVQVPGQAPQALTEPFRSQSLDRHTPPVASGNKQPPQFVTTLTNGVWMAAAFAGVILTLRLIPHFISARKRAQPRPQRPADTSIPSADPKSVKDLTWDEFELLVGEIYRRQGHQAELSAGTGSDGGVDLVLRRGDERILVQCKSWKAWKVNVSEIREFFGVLTAEQAPRGIFVTTGAFTRDALEFAAGKPIEMIDGPALDKLIRTASAAANDDLLNVAGWAPEFLRASRVTVPACPFCKSAMVKRSGSKGNFWGCPTYPRCRGKRELRRHLEA